MHFQRFGALFSILLMGSSLSSYGQTDTSSSQFLQMTLKALAGSSVSDITLSGVVTRNPSSNSKPMSVTLTALSSGANQISFQTPQGLLVETRTISPAGIWAGNWVDPSSKTHKLSYHNMMTEPNWFFPALAVQRALGNHTGLTVSYVGAETFQSAAVQHIRFVATSSASPQVQKWAQTELYLDATTMLPVAFTYNDHPDDNVLVNIPVTVLFSDYSSIGGVTLPTHIQQLKNNALFLDLQIQSAQLNTGATVTLPSAE